MSMPQVQPEIALLVANGFEENHITAVQRTLTKAKLTYKIVAPEQGLVNGWQDGAWGHYFTIDQQINAAMGSDYDLLILPGGEKGIAKLKSNPHTRRIVNHFLEAGKPVAAIGAGVELLALSPKSAGLSVSAADASHTELLAAQMEISDEAQVQDGAVLTADGAEPDAWVEGLMGLIDLAAASRAEEEAQAA